MVDATGDSSGFEDVDSDEEAVIKAQKKQKKSGSKKASGKSAKM